MKMLTVRQYVTSIPTYLVGPVSMRGKYAKGNFEVPLATAEKPLAPSVARGAKATSDAGIDVLLDEHGWSRASVLQAANAKRCAEIREYVAANFALLKKAADATTAYGKLVSITPVIVGRQLYLRMNIHCGDAAGHNMTTKAASAIVATLRARFSDVELVALSSNYCTDKKVSAVNSLVGRGMRVIAETQVSRDDCAHILKTTPEAIARLNCVKNHQGSIIAGSLCSANAHYTNVLAALYLATGQDVANIVEGSQGITSAELQSNGLYFAVTLPNIIVGTVGGGTSLPSQAAALKQLGCAGSGTPVGSNAKKLAEIVAATVLAGELNLLAVLTNKDELVRSHERLERGR